MRRLSLPETGQKHVHIEFFDEWERKRNLYENIAQVEVDEIQAHRKQLEPYGPIDITHDGQAVKH